MNPKPQAPSPKPQAPSPKPFIELSRLRELQNVQSKFGASAGDGLRDRNQVMSWT